MPTDDRSSDVRRVKIPRSDSGFGLTVCGGSDVPHKEGDSGIFVSEVSRSDIDLCVGDRILEANKETLMDVSHDEAIRVLKSSPNVLDLLVEPAQLEFSVSTDDLASLMMTENGFIHTDSPMVESITEVDFGTREEKFAEPPLENGILAHQVEEIEDSSSFSKVFSTVAFIALGAALVAMVLRKQSP